MGTPSQLPSNRNTCSFKGVRIMSCPVCHITVAPFDREKVVVRQTEYHGSCFKKLASTRSNEQTTFVQKKPKQRFIRFHAGLSVH